MRLPQFSFQTRATDHLAEVIATATTEFLAQCLEPEELNFPPMPAFGSWVMARDEESDNQILAVVYHATTGPIDSVHRATALGLSLTELRQQQPQIFAMLKTEFRAVIAGFAVPNGLIYQYLPPRPPQIHQAVYQCNPELIIRFTEKLDFLRTLLQIPGAPVESLVAATLRQVYQLRQFDRPWLIQAGRSLSILLKEDYDRLRYILNQLQI